MSFWKAIDAARVAAEAHWLPQFTLDLMGRNWSLFKIPLELQITTLLQSGTGSSDRTVLIGYPSTWQLDQTYAVQAARLSLTFAVNRSGASGTATLEIVGGPQIAISTSDTQATVTRDYATLPTNGLGELVRATIGGGAVSLQASRSLATFGPNCFLEVLTP